MDSREALIALNLIEHVGPVRARLLLEHFGDAPKILAASKSALLRVRNIGDETAEAIASWEKTIDLAGELKRIAEFGCHVLIQTDENYPRVAPGNLRSAAGALRQRRADGEGQKRRGHGRFAHDHALRHRDRAQAGLSTRLRGRDGRERRRARD